MWQYLSRPYWATSLARKSKGKNQKAKRQGRDKDREKRGEELEEEEGNVASSAPCTRDEHWVRSGESATSSGTYRAAVALSFSLGSWVLHLILVALSSGDKATE